jgi:hypothetical protein
MWTKIIRHRVAFLVGVLVIAVVLAALLQRRSPLGYQVYAGLLVTFTVGLLVACLIARNARRPATFLVRHGGFTTPPRADTVLATAALTVAAVLNVGLATVLTHLNFGLDLDRYEIVSLALWIVALSLWWYRLLGPFGPTLRPDGLSDRQPFGSVFVPWDAGPAAEPTSAGVRLRIARPELVQRRGFRPGTSIRTGADRGFTAWAINLYATRPEYRPAIGTAEGLFLLQPR